MRRMLLALLTCLILVSPARASAAYCHFCDRTSSDGVAFAGDEFYAHPVCTTCEAAAVRTKSDAVARARRVKAMLSGWGVKLNGEPLQLVLGDRARIKRETNHDPGEAWGFSHGEWFRRRDGVKAVSVKVYVVPQLPPDLFEATVAHELLHVWMYQQGCPTEQMAPAFKEGACEVMAWMRLREAASPEGRRWLQAMERTKDPVYGEGFRRQARFVADHGLPALLEALRSRKDFPPGY